MENPQNLPSAGAILQSRAISPALFGLAALFFFFTFCEISCGNQKIASMTGIDLVKGTTINPENGMKDMFKGLGDELKNMDKKLKDGTDEGTETDKEQDLSGDDVLPESKGTPVKPNIFAILALLAAVGGVINFFIHGAWQQKINIILGAVGALALLIMQITMNEAVKTEGGAMVVLTLSFNLPYWGAMLSMITAAALSGLHLSAKRTAVTEDSTPPPPIYFGPEETPPPPPAE